MTQRHIGPALTGIVALAISSCATATQGPVRATPPMPAYGVTATSRSFSLDRIQRTGARSAWDAVKALLPFQQLASTAADAPRLPGAVRVPWESPMRLIIDGHRVDNPNLLREIHASDLVAIHVLRGTDASARFGSAFNGGALIIETRFRRR